MGIDPTVSQREIAFNQEKALVGAFSVIVQLHRLIDLRHYLQQTDHQSAEKGLIVFCSR